jgi:hypothetical protein
VYVREVASGPFLSGEVAFGLLSSSGLMQDDLALIWELADQDKDGNLTEEEFILCMYLINAKLRGILPKIPDKVTPELLIHPKPQSSSYGGPPPLPSSTSNANTAAFQSQVQNFNAADAQYKAEAAAGAYAGKQIGNAAMDRDNQKAAGNKLAEKTDNKALKFVAKNKHVQQHAGKAVNEKANDAEFQRTAIEKGKDGAKSGAQYGAQGAKTGAAYGTQYAAQNGY